MTEPINTGYMPSDKEQTLRILDTIYHEVVSAGGDGDAIWYSEYYSINDILPILTEYNSELKFPFNIKLVTDKTIHWGRDQEGVWNS